MTDLPIPSAQLSISWSFCYILPNPASWTRTLIFRAMVPLLALELHHSIIQNVDNETDLRALALCCTAYRDEAQRCLFANAEPASLPSLKQFLSAINAAPLRLGPMVHTFYADDWGPRDNDFILWFSKALQAMQNLRHLRVRWFEPSKILRGCTFPLYSLVCEFYLVETEISFMLCDFLPAQKNIKHLEMHVTILIDLSKVLPGLCPQLESLALDSESLTSIFAPSSRLISRFEWVNELIPPPLTIHQLNLLKSLKLRIANWGVDYSFTTHLTSLVKLDLHVTIIGSDDLLQKILFVANIPRLQVLILDLRNSYLEMAEEDFYIEFSSCFRQIFELCPHLNQIDVAYDHLDLTFSRLVRQTSMENGGLVWTRQSVHLSDLKEWRYLV